MPTNDVEKLIRSLRLAAPRAEVDRAILRAARKACESASAVELDAPVLIGPKAKARRVEARRAFARPNALEIIVLALAAALIAMMVHTYLLALPPGQLAETPVGEGDDAQKPPLAERSMEEEVAALIRQLGADEFEKRAAADKALAQLGAKITPLLQRARAEAKDGEVAQRLDRLIAYWKPGHILWEAKAGIVPWEGAVSGDRLLVGTNDGKLFCFNAGSGVELWSIKRPGFFISAPALIGERVYIGNNDSHVYCLNAKNGEIIWQFKTGQEVQSSPAVVDERVYVGSFDTKMYCLNAKDGSKLWEHATGAFITAAPALYQDKLYFGGYDRHVYCLDAKSGKEVWKFETEAEVFASAAISKGKVVVPSWDGKLYCLSAVDGRKLWTCDIGKNCYSSPAVAAGRVYIGSRLNKALCLDLEDGRKLWDFPTAADCGECSPAVAGDRVLIGSDAKLYCLSSQDGKQLWSVAATARIGFHPVVTQGVVFAGSHDQKVRCVRVSEDTQAAWPMFRGNLARTGSNDPELAPVK